MGKRSERQRLRARVHGYVQGVGYRQFVARAARRLMLVGYVRNEDDGSVEVLAEGPRGALETLVRRLESGPLLSRVALVESTWESFTGAFSEFRIRQ